MTPANKHSAPKVSAASARHGVIGRLTAEVEAWRNQFSFTAANDAKGLTGRVLHVGCGAGEVDLLLSSERSDITGIVGIDSVSLALTAAIGHRAAMPAEIAKKVSFQQADFGSFNFADNSFDSCLITQVVEQLANPSYLFKEIERVLRPGGSCVVIVPRASLQAESQWNLEPDAWEMLLSRYGKVTSRYVDKLTRQVAVTLTPRAPRLLVTIHAWQEGQDIGRTLDSVADVADEVVIYGSTAGTIGDGDFIDHPLVTHFERREVVTGSAFTQERNEILKLALSKDADWILSLNAGEEFEPGGGEVLRYELSTAHPVEVAFQFDHLFMTQPDRFRFDGFYATNTRRPRMFRVDHTSNVPLTYDDAEDGILAYASVPTRVGTGGRTLPLRILQQPAEGTLISSALPTLPFVTREASLSADPRYLSGYYMHLRSDLLEMIPTDARAVLELGCATGRLGQGLKTRQQCFLAGIEISPEAAHEAARYFDVVHVGDAETVDLPYEEETFDQIICADVLEHLVAPGKVLRRLRRLLKPGGQLLVSVPNIRNFYTLARSLDEGRWEYEDAGILDRTHLRFFTRTDFENVLHRSGYRLLKTQTVHDMRMQFSVESFPADVQIGRTIVRGVDQQELEDLTAVQLYFVAERPLTLDCESGVMQTAPKASIVIAANDDADQLVRCLTSVAEGAPDGQYEVLIVDPGVSHESGAVLSSLDGDVRIIRAARQTARNASRNIAASQATGEWLVFVDERVELQAGWWQNLFAGESEGASVLVGASQSSDGNVIAGLVGIGADGNLTGSIGNAEQAAVNPSCVAVRRDEFHAAGGIEDLYVGSWYAFADLLARLPGSIEATRETISNLDASVLASGESADDLVRYWADWMSPDEA